MTAATKESNDGDSSMMNGEDGLIGVVKVMALTGLARARLTQLVRLGLFPRAERLSHRLWREAEVAAWVAANRPDQPRTPSRPRRTIRKTARRRVDA